MSFKTSKNLLSERDVYSRYYNNFRGVDFSSDHTEINAQRLAYCVNMYRDYNSGLGQALETVPGFRKRLPDSLGGEIYGLHPFSYKSATGDTKEVIVIHAGKKLYRWDYREPNEDGSENYGVIIPKKTKNVLKNGSCVTQAEGSESDGTVYYEIDLAEGINGTVTTLDDISFFSIRLYTSEEGLAGNLHYNAKSEREISKSDMELIGTVLRIRAEAYTGVTSCFCGYFYIYAELPFEMNERKSTSFVINNRLYLLDGKNYCWYTGSALTSPEIASSVSLYTPLTYVSRLPDGTDKGEEYEARNILSSRYRIQFIGDGVTAEYSLDDTVTYASVSVNGAELDASTYTLDGENGKISFSEAPADEASVEITVEGTAVSMFSGEGGYETVSKCTLAAVYDNRVFFSGNPEHPNYIFWCGLNGSGVCDPTYFGMLNYLPVGVESASRITGILAVADTLMVLKGERVQSDGSIYYLTPFETGIGPMPKAYECTRGLQGIGSLGACINFLDDPIFISSLGVEGVGQLSVRYERSIEHRSYLIDAKLLNIGFDKLKNAVLEEWNGYLLLLIDGRIFMADSRQIYTHESGVNQYEWYYLEDVGVFEGQERVEPLGEYTGGEFKKATVIKTIGENLFFGTENGYVCSFNFDKRDENGEIANEWYTFDGRTIFSGAATKMDCCDIPHLTKSTVKKSTVIKTRAMISSVIKVRVRTNRQAFSQIERINTSIFDFNNMAFDDFSFLTDAETVFTVNEKAKRWVEKQYYVFSDEFRKPFSLHYIAYRYTVAGRVK